MSHLTLNLTPELYEYLLQVSLREAPVLKALREQTQQLPGARMQISPEQGQLMALLIELIQAKKTLDIGTFTGYSALIVALSLPKEGKVITCDIDKAATDIAKIYWEKANVAHKIDLRLGPALATLEQMLEGGEAETVDFIFIDADKANYEQYYEHSLALLRKGGLLTIDNVLWSGRVIDKTDQDKSTQQIRTLNQALFIDERISLSMLPIGDGLTLARKR